MEEIKDGEYVRSYLGTIGKVTKIDSNTNTKFLYEHKTLITIEKNVYKHSKNIIDLIEEGDYVNGCKVKFDESFDKLGIVRVYGGNIRHTAIEYFATKNASEKITSIVTKEQFASMEYKVGE